MTALLSEGRLLAAPEYFHTPQQQQRSHSENLKPSKRLCWNTTIQGAGKEQVSSFQGAVSHICRDAGLQENKGERGLSMLYELRRNGDS